MDHSLPSELPILLPRFAKEFQGPGKKSRAVMSWCLWRKWLRDLTSQSLGLTISMEEFQSIWLRDHCHPTSPHKYKFFFPNLSAEVFKKHPQIHCVTLPQMVTLPGSSHPPTAVKILDDTCAFFNPLSRLTLNTGFALLRMLHPLTRTQILLDRQLERHLVFLQHVHLSDVVQLSREHATSSPECSLRFLFHLQQMTFMMHLEHLIVSLNTLLLSQPSLLEAELEFHVFIESHFGVSVEVPLQLSFSDCPSLSLDSPPSSKKPKSRCRGLKLLQQISQRFPSSIWAQLMSLPLSTTVDPPRSPMKMRDLCQSIVSHLRSHHPIHSDSFLCMQPPKKLALVFPLSVRAEDTPFSLNLSLQIFLNVPVGVWPREDPYSVIHAFRIFTPLRLNYSLTFFRNHQKTVLFPLRHYLWFEVLPGVKASFMCRPRLVPHFNHHLDHKRQFFQFYTLRLAINRLFCQWLDLIEKRTQRKRQKKEMLVTQRLSEFQSSFSQSLSLTNKISFFTC